jgi:hypothetical protein
MRQFFIREQDQVRDALLRLAADVRDLLRAGLNVRIKVEDLQPTRSVEQNRIMWSCLNDIARQVEWFVDGKTVKLDPEEWKEILTAGLRKTQRVAAGIEGGFVMLGARTSRMTVAEMTELVDLCHAFGSEHDVAWSVTSLGRDAA